MEYTQEQIKLDHLNHSTNLFRNSTDFSVPPTSHQAPVIKIQQTKKLPKQCRICLENEIETPNKNLIQPCKCNGSVKYVHECCLKKWLTSTITSKNKQQQIKIQQDQGIQCQMCKNIIKFTLIQQYQRKSFNQVLIQFQQKQILLAIFIILIIAAHVGIGFAAYRLSTGKKQFFIKNTVNVDFIISFVGIIILVLFIMMALCAFTKQFLIHQCLKVGKIQLDQEPFKKTLNNINNEHQNV